MRRMERKVDTGGRERRIEGGGNVVSRRFATFISNQEKPFIAGSQSVNKALEKLGEDPSCAFVVMTSNYDKKVVLEAINKNLGNVPILGAIVDDVIYNEESIVHEGVGVALWATDSADISPFIVKGLSRSEEELVKEIRSIFENLKIKRKYTYLVGVVPNVIEGVGLKISRVLTRVSEFMDAAIVGIVGDFKPSPWSIIFNGETYSDHFAFFIIESDAKFGTLFSYGFHPVLPLKITSAQDSIVVELNDIPAYEVFRDFLKRKGFNETDVSSPQKVVQILTRFQVAVADPSKHGRFKGSIIQSLDSSGMRLMTDVSINDTLWIMEFSLEDMFESTQKGVHKSLSHIQDSHGAGMLIFENSMRIRALGEEIDKDKSILRRSLGLAFLGIPTVGEVIIHPEFYSGMHSGVMVGTLFANKVEQP